MKIIDQLDLSEANFEGYQLQSSNKKKIVLSRLNICIGENNSGKSRFIRKVAFLDNYLKIQPDLAYIIKNINSVLSEYITHILVNQNKLPSYFTSFKTKLMTIQNIPLRTILLEKKDINKTYNYFNQLETLLNSSAGEIEHTNFYGYYKKTTTEIIELLNKLKGYLDNKESIGINTMYFPTLRNINNILSIHHNFNQYELPNDELKDDIFTNTIKKLYFTKTEALHISNLKLHTGQDFYINFKRIVHIKEDKKKKLDFEKYLSKTFFNNANIDITASTDGEILVEIGEITHPIHHLGDGINAIICILYKLFLNYENEAIICIEEPETHLHPGMQRILIEALMNKDYFPNFQYFITTHSNHFLDLAFEYPEDISILHFQKKTEADKEYFEINPTTADDIKLLDSLGVRNSSVFLSNCTIWVEGITDRLYLKKYLELYQKTKDQIFHEDLHYSFLEYAGSNIVHWDFENEESKEDMINALKVSNKIFLIMDNDEAEGSKKKSKQELHKRLKKELNNNFHKLEVKEIENLLKVDVVTAALDSINKKGETVSLKTGVSPSSVYTGIGSFIHENYNGLSRTYCDTTKENQTISSKYKTEFCKAACKVMNSYEELSQVAKDLTERVYKFIEEHNRK